MDSENPYLSPAIPAELLEPPWPESGAFRDGSYLVLHHSTLLPPICLKTGLPAETTILAELSGGLSNDDSAPATRKKWYGDKIYAIQVPMSHKAMRRAKRIRAAGLIMAAIMLACLAMVAVGYRQVAAWQMAELLPGAFLAGLVISLAMITESRHNLRLECVARGYFWIANVPKKSLKQFPEWPVPRPSLWRRAFFGPAGVSPNKPIVAELPN